jgi:Zn-dependent protease
MDLDLVNGLKWYIALPLFGNVLTEADRQLGIWRFCAKILSIGFSLNLLLAAFNLVPLPLLDGSNILRLVLPIGAAEKYRTVLAQRGIALFGLFIAWQLLSSFFTPIFHTAVNLLTQYLRHISVCLDLESLYSSIESLPNED